MLQAFEETGEDFFLMLAKGFLGRMENDLCYRGGTDDQVIAVMDKNLYATKKLEERMKENSPLRHSYNDNHVAEMQGNPLQWMVKYRSEAMGGRRAALLKNPDYAEVLSKYK